MRQKRNKFLTVMFSFLPGAGHMFMGFMKTGISLMSAFFFIIFLSSWLNIAPLLFILPMLWFYSFFDCINRRYASDEEFAMLNDNYLFSIDKLAAANNLFFQKRRLYTGILLLVIGAYLIFNSSLNSVWIRYLPIQIQSIFRDIARLFPQLALGIIIVIIGVKLIIVKKEECDSNV